MESGDALSRRHPAAAFLFFCFAALLPMFCADPISQLLSFLAAACYSLRLKGREALRFQLRGMLPMVLLVTAVNALLVRRGQTVLTYLPAGKPVTLESLVYGAGTGLLLAAVMTWFSCWNAVMTSDKLLCLFGRRAPALSLVLVMSLRLVPRLKAQMAEISDAQKPFGRDVSKGKLLRRLKSALDQLSILLTCALENAVETADSMKARGWGLSGRSFYSPFRFTGRDGLLALWISLCGVFVLYGWGSGSFLWDCYPTIRTAPMTVRNVSFRLVYFALCMTPVILDLWEERRWNRLRAAGKKGGEARA